jgi:hypothetical protein
VHKIFNLYIFFTLIILSSCSKDDTPSPFDSFLEGALNSATSQQIEGTWSIFQIEFENNTIDVPASFVECGRDFFDFQPDNQYREYLFDDNFECTPQINILNWSLSNGIITLSNDNETEQLVITELTSERLVFKFRFDLDEDGEIEIFKAICNRYEPPAEIDIYSGSFYWDNTVTNLDKITLKWDSYRGYNEFEKYEIYRLDENCDVNNAVLISTITDVNQSTFIDLTPPPYQDLCYIFKLYTSQGLLSESTPVMVDTSFIEVQPVNLSEPNSNNNMIVDLNWESYQGYYFSHYEIEVRNYTSGSGGGYQEEQIAVINDIETLHTSVELPYFSNPVFVINVYNIFGRRSQTVSGIQNLRSTNFIREDILPINFIKFAAFSTSETVLYYSNFSNLYRYNYESKSVESSTLLNSSSIVFIKVFDSPFGTEVIVNLGNELKVYDSNLNFKYNLSTPIFNPEHLIVTEDGFWLITDREKLYSFSRNHNELNLISTNNLYNQSFSSSTINVVDLGQNKILAGHYYQSQGLIIDIDANGVLSNAVFHEINATSQWRNNSLYSKNQQYLLNIEGNTLYSTSTYDLITTLSQDFFPSGISSDGTLILGTNNNPSSLSNDYHEKNVRTLSYPNLTEQVYNSKGYPHILYENHVGQLVCISKGLLGKLDSSTPENDIFIEIIE